MLTRTLIIWLRTHSTLIFEYSPAIDQCVVFQGEDHMTCLHYAAKSGHVDIIQYILDINAVDVNATVRMLRRSPHPVFDHYM